VPKLVDIGLQIQILLNKMYAFFLANCIPLSLIVLNTKVRKIESLVQSLFNILHLNIYTRILEMHSLQYTTCIKWSDYERRYEITKLTHHY
jgi:hypothetical protein